MRAGAAALLLFLLLVTRPVRAQSSYMDSLVCADPGTPAFRMVWVVRQVREARVFATTQAQRVALARLEPMALAVLDASPAVAREAWYRMLWQQNLEAVEQRRQDIEDRMSPRAVSHVLHSMYENAVQFAREQLSLVCDGRQRWPALYAAALMAEAL